MANDRSMERLERLRETPPFKVTAWQLNWHNDPNRPEIANTATWLRPEDKDNQTDYDAPIWRAFKFFDLDARDPRHWRILMTNLAMGFFPNPKKRGKTSLKTNLDNAELLEKVNRQRDDIWLREKRRAGDTELLRAVVKKHKDDSSIKSLQKKLNAARKAAGYPAK